MKLPLIKGWKVPKGKTRQPATNPDARKFIVSLVDDDAGEYLGGTWTTGSEPADYPYHGGYYSRLHPVIVAANRYLLANGLITAGNEIAFTESPYTSNINNTGSNDNVWRFRQCKILQDVYGWNIASHSVNHGLYFDPVTNFEGNPTALENEINGSFDYLTALGFNVDTLTYPIGGHSNLVRSKVAEKYDCAIATGNTFDNRLLCNIPPFNKYALIRYTLDVINFAASNGDCTNPTAALNLFKTVINEARDSKGWLITMSHASAYSWKNYNSLSIDPSYPPEWIKPVSLLGSDYLTSNNHIVPEGWYPYPNSLLDVLYKLIIYIYEQGGEIVLPKRGIELMGNVETIGDVTNGVVGLTASNDQLNYPHFAKGVDGSLTAYR